MFALECVVNALLRSLTEIMPVSVSGHEMVLQHLVPGWGLHPAVDFALQAGVFFGVVLYFVRDLAHMLRESAGMTLRALTSRRRFLVIDYPHCLWVVWLALASVPTALIAFNFLQAAHTFFRPLELLGLAWIATGLLYFRSSPDPDGRTLYEMNHQDAFLIGLVQGLAVIPGVSRPGAAMLAAFAVGLEPKSAVKFSYLLALPVLAVSGWIKLQAVESLPFSMHYLFAAFAAASLATPLALAVITRVLERGTLRPFATYGLAIGILCLAWGLVRRFGLP